MPLKVSHIALAILAACLAIEARAPGGARAEPWTNPVGMEFVPVPAGTFVMGEEPSLSPDADPDEGPPHAVTLTRGFWCGATEVTQAQWERVMGAPSPSLFQGPGRPVERVSYGEAIAFIEALNALEGTGRYRLLTEAEWTYAAKAGTVTPWSFGADPAVAGGYAWYRANSGMETRPAAGKFPNPWGLFDMHGNVWEWVSDWYGAGWYLESPADDPQGPAAGEEKVVRGGAWDNRLPQLRSDNRTSQLPGAKDESVGFRVAFTRGLLKKRLYPADGSPREE
ncbi:MAG: formylglycine-generating enzyme family protein [Deltaproteobacteria bacterium]|jgi:formylglycine-generating enzyme required for sulfatase activity|nr:formylglycine-generating enzyme family protein [Deltaproteobacteria bacterium]